MAPMSDFQTDGETDLLARELEHEHGDAFHVSNADACGTVISADARGTLWPLVIVEPLALGEPQHRDEVNLADRDGVSDVEVMVAVAVSQALCALVGAVAGSGEIGGVVGVVVETHEKEVGFVTRGFASRPKNAVVTGAESETDVALAKLGVCREADYHQ